MQETAEEYLRMEKMFEMACNLWKENDNDHNLKIVIELEKEALRENADWLLLHLHVPENIPL